ncbi:MAG: arylsulfatase A-like enzyme [Verrucomicrobiales bacterium]|jgi:arylsulfatase A-like enzyme
MTLKSGLLFLLLFLTARSLQAEDRPNIVWIIPDDMSANFSCYGETAIETPNVDKLAAEGVKFTRAFVTAPVCSTCRSAFITGMYQTSIGAHHHRSGRGNEKIRLPEKIKLVPKLFQEAGYHTSITAWPPKKGKLGKTDYNFEWDPAVYDRSDWSERKDGQPFFVQIQTPGGKLRGKDAAGWEKIAGLAEKRLGSRTPLDAVKLPPYYPAHPDIVRDWAAYLDSVRMTDAMVGDVIARLEKEGVRDKTMVLFMTDHGISHARGKQFMYDEGLHVPLVISGPGIAAGSVRHDVVEHIDIAALSLAAAGIEIPDHMQAKDILSKTYTPREVAFSARDRCDETIDHMRSVRTRNFKYIRNFLPNRPYLQPCRYKDAKSILIALREWNAAGKLDATQKLIMRDTRPLEELYDLKADPHEIHNLAADPKHANELNEMRRRLNAWMERTDDKGRQPETSQMYASDMAVYLTKRNMDPAHLKRIEDNIALNKKWAAEEARTN